MNKLNSRGKGKAAGAYMILFALLNLLRNLSNWNTIKQFAAEPNSTLFIIRAILLAACCIFFVVFAMMNKNNLALFILGVIYFVVNELFLIYNFICDNFTFSLAMALNVLSLISFAIVIAFNLFNRNKLVKYTWYLPAVLFVTGYLANIIQMICEQPQEYLPQYMNVLLTGTRSLSLWGLCALEVVAYFYIGLWLEAKAEEQTPTLGCGF